MWKVGLGYGLGEIHSEINEAPNLKSTAKSTVNLQSVPLGGAFDTLCLIVTRLPHVRARAKGFCICQVDEWTLYLFDTGEWDPLGPHSASPPSLRMFR